MTTKTKTTKGATTLSSSDERVTEGLAFKDATGTYSEFLIIYEEPGPTGLRTCGKALADAHGNEFPCLKTQGKKAILVTDISVAGEGKDDYSAVSHRPCT